MIKWKRRVVLSFLIHTMCTVRIFKRFWEPTRFGIDFRIINTMIIVTAIFILNSISK